MHLDSKTKLVEHLAIVSRNEGEDISSTSEDAYEAKPFLTECKISYEEVSPTQLVEYKFKESPRWYLGMSTRLYLEAFRKSKFKSWKELILTTTCQKTLKRYPVLENAYTRHWVIRCISTYSQYCLVVLFSHFFAAEFGCGALVINWCVSL